MGSVRLYRDTIIILLRNKLEGRHLMLNLSTTTRVLTGYTSVEFGVRVCYNLFHEYHLNRKWGTPVFGSYYVTWLQFMTNVMGAKGHTPKEFRSYGVNNRCRWLC